MKKNISTNSIIEFAPPHLLRVIAAMVYDTLLLAAISIAYGALIVGLRILIYGQPQVGQHIEWSLWARILITSGWVVALMSFYVYFWCKFGQTLGMKTWRFQAVDSETNQLPSVSQSFRRSLVAIFSLGFFGIGYWCSFLHPKRRFMHDLLSGTKLILLKSNKK